MYKLDGIQCTNHHSPSLVPITLLSQLPITRQTRPATVRNSWVQTISIISLSFNVQAPALTSECYIELVNSIISGFCSFQAIFHYEQAAQYYRGEESNRFKYTEVFLNHINQY